MGLPRSMLSLRERRLRSSYWQAHRVTSWARGRLTVAWRGPSAGSVAIAAVPAAAMPTSTVVASATATARVAGTAVARASRAEMA